MIKLVLDKPRNFQIGEVVHLKIVKITEQGTMVWRINAIDVTPIESIDGVIMPPYEPRPGEQERECPEGTTDD